MATDAGLRKQLIELIKGGNAHVEFEKAIKAFPHDLQGKRPDGCPHSPWELLEHMRIAQWDILEFTKEAKHKSPKWPDEYWPASPAPSNSQAWDQSVKSFLADMESMCALVADTSRDLDAPIAHGDGQTLLREALLVADHNAYHLGQFVLVRKMLGEWK